MSGTIARMIEPRTRLLDGAPEARRALGETLLGAGWEPDGRWSWTARGSHVSAQITYQARPGVSRVEYNFAVVWNEVKDMADYGRAWPWTQMDNFNEQFHSAPDWVFSLPPLAYVARIATDVLLPLSRELLDPQRYLAWLLTDGTWPGFTWLPSFVSRQVLMEYAYIGTVLGVGTDLDRQRAEEWLLASDGADGMPPTDLAALHRRFGQA